MKTFFYVGLKKIVMTKKSPKGSRLLSSHILQYFTVSVTAFVPRVIFMSAEKTIKI